MFVWVHIQKNKRMKKLDKEINYIECYLTLRCNLNCSYCINDNNTVKRKRNEMIGESWIEQLNDINFGEIPLTIGGGEPTIHKDFYKILKGLKPEIKVDLLTNLQFDVDEFIANVSPDRFTQKEDSAYKSIRVSYHAEQMNPQELVNKASKLQEAGFRIGIFGLTNPMLGIQNNMMAEYTRQKKIFFHSKDFMGELNGQMYGTYKYPEGLSGKLENVLCKSREILIAPDGFIYKCHRDLYKSENAIGELKHSLPKPQYRKCSNFGDCNYCDLKLKANYFLNGIDCQVDIIKEK